MFFNRCLYTFSIAFLCTAMAVAGCKKKATEAVVELPFSGSYTWNFTIPNYGSQTSVHTFDKNIIRYKMMGDAYNVTYEMTVIRYDKTVGKCITEVKDGSTKKGKFFVLFFKDITDKTMFIYKAELSTLAEADSFERPADNDTRHHGWNKYEKQ